MAKKREQYESEILAIIEKHKICRINHIFGVYAGLSCSQFYNLELEKSESIKEAIERNRLKATQYLLQKWIASNNPTLQIAAMRLVCSKEEHQLLNQHYIDHTTGGEKLQQNIIVATEEGKALLKRLDESETNNSAE